MTFDRKLGITAIAATLLWSACTSPDTKEKPSKAYRIAYNVWYDRANDDYEVFSMNTDGSDKRNISNWAGVDWVYYANADKVYFISDRDTTHRMYFLYEMDAFGNNVRKVYDQRLQDSWLSARRGGTELIVDPRVAGDSALHIISNQGALIAKLYTNLPYYNDPFFSPDGTQVVFRGATRAFKKENGYIDELYTINVDGSGLTQLTQYPKADTLSEWWNYHAGPPFWEPNRNVITYNSVQDGYSSLFLINPQGDAAPNRITPDSLYAAWHAWSSDGEWIVFDGYERAAGTEEQFDIYLMNFNSKTIRKVASDTTNEQAPVLVEVAVD